MLIYSVNNNSFWLIHHGNSGFVGENSFNFIYNYIPLIDSDVFKIALVILFLFFFTLSSGISIKKIFPYLASLFEKVFKKNKINEEKIEENSNQYPVNKDDQNPSSYKQQSFLFKKIDEKKEEPMNYHL